MYNVLIVCEKDTFLKNSIIILAQLNSMRLDWADKYERACVYVRHVRLLFYPIQLICTNASYREKARNYVDHFILQ